MLYLVRRRNRWAHEYDRKVEGMRGCDLFAEQ
jgi:hypothetical protein